MKASRLIAAILSLSLLTACGDGESSTDAVCSTEAAWEHSTASAQVQEMSSAESAEVTVPPAETEAPEEHGLSHCMHGLSESEQQRVYELLSEMTLHEKLFQMMITSPSHITDVKKVTAAGESTQSALAEYPVGGLFYNASNMESKEQVAAMLENTQTFCEIPVLTMCDEEGGAVSRLMKSVGTTWVDSMLTYEAEGAQTARRNASVIASDMAALGFNLDLAPVADVWSNPENTVIAERAYSTDFHTAAELVAAAVEGFHEGGVACTLKHFPGHGDTYQDSHHSTAIVDKSLDELREAELLPFQAGIDAGADVVMMGHLTLPQVDELPALFSYTIVTELLRGEMGFDGVIMTDALEMDAVKDHFEVGEAAVLAVRAGVDMLLCPENLTQSAAAIEQAIADGKITEHRIDESVARILALKIRRGIM